MTRPTDRIIKRAKEPEEPATPDDDAIRVLALAPDPALAALCDRELVPSGIMLQIARSVSEVVAALVEDPPPRAQILILDFDPLSASDAFQLHAIREKGWFGAILAVGAVSSELRTSLNVDREVRRPVADGALHEAVTRIGLSRATTKMPSFRGRRR